METRRYGDTGTRRYGDYILMQILKSSRNYATAGNLGIFKQRRPPTPTQEISLLDKGLMLGRQKLWV
jgi:hypothetical protein